MAYRVMLRLVPPSDQEKNVAADWLEHYFVAAHCLAGPGHDRIVGHEFTDSKEPSNSLKIIQVIFGRFSDLT